MESKKSEIKSITQDFRKLIEQYRCRYKKNSLKALKRALRLDEKAANDEKEHDLEYLQDIINR